MPRKPRRVTAEQLRDQLLHRQAAKRDADRLPENWGADTDALRSQDDVQLTPAQRGGVVRAQRQDVFARLLARGSLSKPACDAARRLDDDMAKRRGEGDRWSGAGERLDGDTGRGAMDHQLAAGERVDAVLAGVGARDRALLIELLAPSRVHSTAPQRWRLVVALICGEKGEDAQAACIRMAAENLAAAYREIDSGRRRAA